MRLEDVVALRKRSAHGKARFLPGAVALNLDAAPVLSPVTLQAPAGAKRLETDFVFVSPTFGLSPADIEAGKAAELYRAELRAWSMLRVCQWCQRRFLPARRNCSFCSRGCYLLWFRREETRQRREALPVNICIRCGREFQASRGRGETCSVACCQAVYQKRRRELMKAELIGPKSAASVLKSGWRVLEVGCGLDAAVCR